MCAEPCDRSPACPGVAVGDTASGCVRDQLPITVSPASCLEGAKVIRSYGDQSKRASNIALSEVNEEGASARDTGTPRPLSICRSRAAESNATPAWRKRSASAASKDVVADCRRAPCNA